MSLRRAVFRGLNRALAQAGLRLDLQRLDFDDYPLDDFSRKSLLVALADGFDQWRSGQKIVERHAEFEALDAVGCFFEGWQAQPFRQQQGGSRFNNLLWLHLVARMYAPDIIVDSGSYQGASAWALALAAPDAQTLSFDIDMSQLKSRTAGVTYVQTDWTSHTLPPAPNGRMLCYFDDHVDQARRLIEAGARGCSLAVFDDDYPVTSFYAMAPSPSVLPKVEFVLDDRLKDGQVLRWLAGGREQTWTVDRSYLDAARATILATERLPNTSLVTGIHQTPYRLVTLKAAS